MSEAALIAAFEAGRDTRVPEPAPTIDTVMNAVRAGGPIVVPMDGDFTKFLVDARHTIDRATLLERANRRRRQTGLAPWAETDITWSRPATPEEPYTQQHYRKRGAAATAAKRRAGQ